VHCNHLSHLLVVTLVENLVLHVGSDLILALTVEDGGKLGLVQDMDPQNTKPFDGRGIRRLVRVLRWDDALREAA
jgi:hypothetical protein